MHRETVTYVDYNGVERTENFYFNLNKAELLEMEMGTTGGFVEMLQNIVAAKDTPALVKIFKEFILKAYGEKSPDGRRFIKSKELSDAFSQTEAYSQLYVKFATDSNAASKFINGVVPSDMSKPHPESNN